MAPNFRCKFKKQPKTCLQEIFYIIRFQSRVNRPVCDVINFLINVILSYLLCYVIMSIAVSFSLRFAVNVLNMS